MKVENHELRKRVLAAQGDAEYQRRRRDVVATYSLPVGYPQIVVNSKGNPLQHPVLSGLGNIVSCPDD